MTPPDHELQQQSLRCLPHTQDWLEKLSVAHLSGENLQVANHVISSFTKILLDSAFKVTNLGDKQIASNQEWRARLVSKHLLAALFLIKQAETDGVFQHKAWRKLNRLLQDTVKFQPSVLPISSPEWKEWKKRMVQEKKRRHLIWINLIRTFTPNTAKLGRRNRPYGFWGSHGIEWCEGIFWFVFYEIWRVDTTGAILSTLQIS